MEAVRTLGNSAATEAWDKGVVEMTAAGGRAHRLAACDCWAPTAGSAVEMMAAGGRAHRLAACGCLATYAGY